MRRLLPLPLLVAILGLVAAPAAAKPVPRAPAGWIGVMADGPMIRPSGAPAGEWKRMARARAQTVRAAFYWSEAEPAPGVHDWSRTDALVRGSARQRMRVLPVVLRAPRWARASAGDEASPPRDYRDYGRFLAALVARYGPSGSFWAQHPGLPRRPIRAWQVWNEPDQEFYWRPRPFAASYVRLLREAAAAIRTADPGAKVVLAGLTNQSWVPLREIYRAGGRGAFDAVALHPYTARPKNVVRVLRYGRQVMAEYGDRRVPVWATEISFPAINPKRVRNHPPFKTTRQGQARLLEDTVRRLARNRKRLRIGKVIWYTWMSAYRSDEWPDYSGLRRYRESGTTSMPALKRFRRVARELQR